MTDLYGVRVLAADHAARTLRIRVSVLYYDTDSHAPLTDDPSFFYRILRETAWDDAPLCEVTTRDQYLDEEWVDLHTRWFVERAERLATRNHPWPGTEELLDEDEEFDEEDEEAEAEYDEDDELPWEGYIGFPWEEDVRFQDMKPGAAAELVQAEEMRVGADYEVVVTDARWMRHLSEGDWWRTASYPTHADMPLPGEAPRVPDLRRPRAVLKPFGTAESHHLAFSDDGRRLAVSHSEQGELAVYDTADWNECLRASAENPDDYVCPWLSWVPGEPVVVLRHYEEALPQLAYDTGSGARVQAPAQTGRLRSATGRYRTTYASGPRVALLTPDGGDGGMREIPLGAGSEGAGTPDGSVDQFHGVTFTADESRMFVACGERVYVLDPADGRTLDVIRHHDTIQSVRVSPDGELLAVIGKFAEVTIRRVGDHRVVTNHRNREGRLCQAVATAWSPDGRHLAVSLRVLDEHWDPADGEIRVYGTGLATEPPPELVR
ncbi:hypothetical protein HUT18_20420 [Streptomyces sp. NA04227]|uniref:WD40 repeat domain-containing protein n=1 Tax=Streptomyces sp. NA04227 TaxID=2742136 RepID=UPI00159252EC|nr:WD40 repeat domain-containing protein [Streptomyces sp. NA04227]QKW08383.1 hypothetical protein HUT18_20420 [Streptomyces sp. NA04227]